jgi:hypothetical protein
MKTKIIEAAQTDKGPNWGKFLVARFDEEWSRRAKAPGCDRSMPLLGQIGWTSNHIWVLDLQTGEGAYFMPGGFAKADLNKHRIWVCPMFEPFLEWLYKQKLDDLDALPDFVAIEAAPAAMSGYRRKGRKPVPGETHTWEECNWQGCGFHGRD